MSNNPSQRNSSSDTGTAKAGVANEDDAQQFQQIIRDRRYEREDIQKKAFTKWINNQLANTSSTLVVTDLFQDLRDGIVLLRLLEVLTGNEYKRENGKMRVHHIGNVNKVIAILNEHGIKLLSISSNDIVDGNPKLTLALIWSIIQYWQGKDVRESVAPDSQQTNIEKFLLSWCQQQTKGYKGVEINDFTRSWQDGLAFNALIHKFRPDLFDYEELLQNASARNLEHAFSVAKNVFKIDRYLDVEDVLSDFPDRKSILMYVMCLFQQLPSSIMVIEDNEKNEPQTKTTTTTIINDKRTEAKSLSENDSTQLRTYQANMERILHWILKLENELDKQDKTVSDDLKSLKEQFQNHEEFMISLTKDQNQIGDVLLEGNKILTSKKFHLPPQQENEIKEQMKTLNHRWELLRSKSLDRQSILHKTLMKLQIDQIESFDTWLFQTEKRISTELDLVEPNLSDIDRQYQQLAQLQDELVAQQVITESLQNMIIVIDDSASIDENSPSKYTASEIEAKLLSLSERWANICNFVHNRWQQLHDVKVEFEQIELNRDKVNKWFVTTEEEMNKINTEKDTTDSEILTKQIRSIQKIESEMNDIRQSILSLDNSLKILSTFYDSTSSNELKSLNEQINNFEKRWSQLINDLEQCSARLKKLYSATEKNVQTPTKLNNNFSQKTITTTTVEEKTTHQDNLDDSTTKKRKITIESTQKFDFDLSARKFFDWIESIENILNDKPSNLSQYTERTQIIQEVKTKYLSYDDQFRSLIQTGNVIAKQLKDANEDSTEHESSLKLLEKRWVELHKLILICEHDIEQARFNEEINALTKARAEYKLWLESTNPSDTSTEIKAKLESFQSYNERLAQLQHMAHRFDTDTVQRTDDLLRSWDETHSQLRERTIPIEHMHQEPSGVTTGSGVTTAHQTVISSVPISPSRSEINEQSTTTATTTTTTTNLGPSIGENGSVFTLTNIYTFGGGDGGSTTGISDLGTDKYRVKSYVEVFDQPSGYQESDYERHYRETHSSSSYTRKVRTSATDTYDYGPTGNHESSHFHRQFETTIPTSIVHTSEQKSPGTNYFSSLPTLFTDIQCKLRVWLEYVEQSLLGDKIRICDSHTINTKKKVYKDLLEQTCEQERNLETLNKIANEYYSKLTIEVTRRVQDELINYRDRLNDIKMFLSERLAKCHSVEKKLNEFESGMEEVRIWIRNAQTRLTSDTGSLENQLGRSQTIQQEIRETQTIVNRLNRDIIDITKEGDETLTRRLKDDMQQINESWSRFISSTKTYSQNVQDTIQRNRLLQEEIRDLEDWLLDKERETFLDDGSIFYHEQFRERLEQYQRLQSELTLKEHTLRVLIDRSRQDATQPSPELNQYLDTLVTSWSSFQKKVDSKITLYSELHRLHEELRELIYQENAWLDALQNRIYTPVNHSADAQEASEELESLDRFVKNHSKTNHERIFSISDRLQTLKVSVPTINSQINQFQLRWEQLHDDFAKRVHALNAHISDNQQLGQQISAMVEWMNHTDSILNSRLKDDVYASDVPSEAEKLAVEFHQYEAFLRTIEDKINGLRIVGKNDAARRLEQQYVLIKNQFNQLKNKFRQFQKPSDFEPKYARMRQILIDVEQNLYALEIRSDDPDVVHNQLEHCLKLYKTLSDIKTEVEYVIRVGRSIVEKGQIDESSDLTRQIDQLKATYNNLGAKVSTTRNQLDSVERHLRKFRKEYSHIHEWFVKADNEIRKIENKPVSKNNKEEIDWIRATRNDIRKLEANFEVLRNLERAIQKDSDRPLPGLHEKINELKRQIDQLDRRLKDRYEIVEGQVRKLEDDYQRFTHIYKGIMIRLEKLDSLLSDAERVLDLTRISQVQEELRSVRTQLDEILNLGQELVSKSETYSKLVGPDIENITRNFEELQRRIRIIQEKQDRRLREQQGATTTTTSMTTTKTNNNNNIHDDQRDDTRREYYSEKRYTRTEREARHRSPSESSDISTSHGVVDEEFKKKYLRCLAYMKLIERLYDQQETDDDFDIKHRRSRRERTIRDRPEYEEIERIIRETEERAYIIEKTDVEQARRIREKIRRLRDCLENLKTRSEQCQVNDEVVRYNERYQEHIRTFDRTVPKERELDSDFIYDIDDTRSVISEPAPFCNSKYRKTVHSLERYRTDDQTRFAPSQEEYQLQPLLRVRSLKAIDHRTLSAPSSPILQPRYRSYERSNVQYTKQTKNQQGHQDTMQSSISKSASMPNGGFPMQQSLLPQPPPPPHFYPQQPMVYRERVIDRHVAEKSTSKGESHRQQRQESSGHFQQQQQQQTRSASTSGQTQTLNRSIPVQYEGSSGFRTASSFSNEHHPNYFYSEQHASSGGAGGASSSFRQQTNGQQTYPAQTVGCHPKRI